MTAEPSTPRREPVEIPTDMLAFNRALIEEFRATGGQLSGRMAGRSLLLLTTTGARSGQPRTTVLGYGRDGDRYAVIASGNAAPAHPAWYRNLLANPVATVEIGAETVEVRAETATAPERERLASVLPWLESQQKLTSREIPVVVLTPRPRGGAH
jgi:deazaflavin-dependent oxidoreductase (nitroreductase family)